MIELLIRHGARLTSRSFFAANEREEPELLELIIKWGWDMDSTRFGQSAVQLIDTLQRRICAPNIVQYPHRAALTHPKILIWLLENGANPDTISNPGPSAPVQTDSRPSQPRLNFPIRVQRKHFWTMAQRCILWPSSTLCRNRTRTVWRLRDCW
jgi:hypothetical protein